MCARGILFDTFLTASDTLIVWPCKKSFYLYLNIPFMQFIFWLLHISRTISKILQQNDVFFFSEIKCKLYWTRRLAPTHDYETWMGLNILKNLMQ